MSYILESPRLRFRKPSNADLPFLEQVLGDRSLTNHPGELPEGEQVAVVARSILDAWNVRAHGPCIFELRADGRPIGVGGLKYVILNDVSCVDLGMMLLAGFQNDGFGFEAGKAFLKYGFVDLGLNRIVARTTPTNVAAKTLLKKWRFEATLEETTWELTRQRWTNDPLA